MPTMPRRPATPRGSMRRAATGWRQSVRCSRRNRIGRGRSTKPPYLAYPLVGAIAYTFGGLATNEKAEVLGENGPMPGLYAAGETTGHFYGTAPNAVSVLRALVFGKIAGRQAVDFLRTR